MIDRVQHRLSRGGSGSIPRRLAIVAALLAAHVMIAAAAPNGVSHSQSRAEVMLIAPALPDASRAAQARGVFYRQTARVHLTGGALELASSPDGLGPLCTDDQATLIFTTGGQEIGRWSHRFSADDRRAIVCIPSQRLEPVLEEGTYEITVELEDLYPDTYGSTAYYLIIGADDAVPPDAQGTATPFPTPVIPSTPAGPAQIAAPTRGQILPTATQTQGSISRGAGPAAPTTPVPLASGARGVEGDVTRWSPFILGLIVGALLLGILALARRGKRPPSDRAPALAGVLYLFDRETREARTAMLSDDTHRIEVRRRPLSVVALPAQEQRGVVVAQVWSTCAGPMFHDLTDANGVPKRLERDVPHTIAGAVELRYRAQHTFLGPQDTARAHAERSQ